MQSVKIKEDNEYRCVLGWLRWFGLHIPGRNVRINEKNLKRYFSWILSKQTVNYLNKKRKSGPAKIHYQRMKNDVLNTLSLSGTDIEGLFDIVFVKYVHAVNRTPFVKKTRIEALPSKGRFGVEIYDIKEELTLPDPETIFWDTSW